MIGIGATLFKRMAGGSRFSPASLFNSGEQGAWYDPSDLSTLFENPYGTTPATVGNPVGLVLDKSKALETQSIAPSGTGGTATYTAETKTVVFDRNGNYGTINFPATVGEVFRISGTVTIADTATSLKDAADPNFPTIAVLDSFGTYDFNTYFTCLTQDDLVLYITNYGAGSTPVTITGLSVEKVLGNHAIQQTSAKRPTLRQAGSLYYLEFDGAQGLKTPLTVDFTGTDSMSVFSGVRKELDASENIAELSANVGGNTGAFRLSSNINGQWRYGSRGDDFVKNATATGYAAPSTNVVTGISDISDNVSRIRVDDDFTFTNTGDQGAGNYGNYDLNIGARNNAGGLQLNGFIYGLIVRGATSSSKEIDSTEAYMAAKSGVTL